MDDGSTDESAAIVESYADPRICLVRNSANRGQTPCLNQGLRAARGEFVARQDADDLSHPDRLEKQIHFLDAHPEIALLGANAQLIDEADRPLGTTNLPRDTPAIRWANLFDNSFLHSAVMFRTKIIRDEFGGYDESFTCSQDYALWSRVARANAVANLPDHLISLRVHPNSLMRAANSSLEMETEKILRANLAAEFPERQFSEAEIGSLSEFRRSLAPGSFSRFGVLFDSLDAEFLRMHPEAYGNQGIRAHAGAPIRAHGLQSPRMRPIRGSGCIRLRTAKMPSNFLRSFPGAGSLHWRCLAIPRANCIGAFSNQIGGS